MNQLRALTILSFGLVLASVGLAQERTQDTPLRRVEKTFAAADVNLDGGLDVSEIAEVGIPASVLRTWDHDGDRNLTRDEFLLYYRQLMINAGKQPGAELDAEAKRIAELRRSREIQEARRQAREKELADLRQSRGQETPEEKYRRAQAALEAREKATSERSALEIAADDGNADVQAATRARVARAQASLQDLGQDEKPPVTDPPDRSKAALALVRALDALEDRVKSGEWTREQFERARLDLILRARAIRIPGQSADERTEVAKALIRSLDAMESRARTGKWSREQYVDQRQALILRARATAAGSAEKPQPPNPDDPSELARALVRSLDALENRARSGNWSREQFEEARFELIRRARAIAQKKGIAANRDEEALSRVVQALTRSLDAMESRARSGGWTREQYEAQRIELILRARASQDGKQPPTPERPAPATGEPTPGEAAEEAVVFDPSDPKQAAAALVRALDALENRSRSGNWSREQFERERLVLITRARGVDLGVPEAEAGASQARSRAARALARALDALDDRARSSQWTREMVERERLDLILRARASQERSDDPPPPPPVPPGERADPALALVRSLDAMESRARTGNWTREQFEKARLQLILRARGVDLGAASGEPAGRQGAAQALARALDAMESRARTGKWTREMYEQQRAELIRRASAVRGGGDRPPGANEPPKAERPKTERPKTERPKREGQGLEVEKVRGAAKVERAPDKEAKTGGTGSDAKKTGGADAKKTGGADAKKTGGADAKKTGGADAKKTGGAERGQADRGGAKKEGGQKQREQQERDGR